ncbi:hypothetical protein ACHWQZ_G009183 [Mnemiopsis leidyi]
MNSLSFRRKRNIASENQQREYIEWVNEWLAKKAYPTRVFSVPNDFQSGVIFAVIIELVGGVKLYGIEDHPTSKSQQDENVNSCLEFLAQRGLQPDNVPDPSGIVSGDVVSTMSVLHQISKLDPNSKLKPVNLKAIRAGKKTLDRQLSDRYPTQSGSINEFNKSATIGPCGAKSMPVLYRSFDSLSGSDIQRRSQGSQEILSPTRPKRPNSFDLSPDTPVILEDQDMDDEGIIQIGQRKIRESQNNENYNSQNTRSDFKRTQSLSLRRTGPNPIMMDNVMLKINGNHSIRHSRPLLNGPISPIHPAVVTPQTRGSVTAQQGTEGGLYDHLRSASSVSNSTNNIAGNGSMDCLSNTDNNSSRCDNMSDRNSFTSLQWDNSSHVKTNIHHSNTSLDEQRTQNELHLLNQIKLLKRELEKSRSKEESSRDQLNTNNHMLAAFQKSIESLTSRLEHETNQNELKEAELERLRAHSMAGSSPGNGKVGASPGNGKSHTLQRHNTYNGSYSDFSDIDNENPSHFDRRKKTRKSWKGSLTRAFSRGKKKEWEEEWDSSSPSPRHVTSPDEHINGNTSNGSNLIIEHQKIPNSRYESICANCKKLETQIRNLNQEVQDLKNKSKTVQNSLVNYIKDERSDRQVLYRIAVLIHCHNTQYTVGSVGITDTTSWSDLDAMILTCLANHLQLIDPGKQLGLRTTSLKDYTLDTVRRRLDGSEAAPSVDVREMRGAIVVNFRTGAGCDNISYDSLLPLSFLKIAQSALKMEHVTCISGPRYTGKSYIAELLGRNLLSELRPDDHQVQNLIVYECSELNDQDSLKKFETRLSSSTTPVVAIVNDYTQTAISTETIKTIRESPGAKYSFILLLTEETETQPLRDIRVVRCSPQSEPFQGLLDRHFNRLLATQPPEQRPKLKHIFNWFVSVWRHVNDTLKQHVDGTCLMGPTQFMSCPPDVEKSEEWFLSLWNMTLTPHLISTVKHGLQVYGRKHACWADPVDFIKGSYPWTTSREYCDLLQGINSSEINFDSYRSGPLIGGSNLLTQDQIEEVVKCLKDHLRISTVTANTTPNSTPCHSSRDLSNGSRDLSNGSRDLNNGSCDPAPPVRTTSFSSGSEEAIASGRIVEADGYRSMRRRVPVQSPTKPTEVQHRENGYHYQQQVRDCGLRAPPQENGYHGNSFQRGIPGRQSLPVNQSNRGYVSEQYGNMYYGSQRPLNATPTKTAVNNSYNNLGKA